MYKKRENYLYLKTYHYKIAQNLYKGKFFKNPEKNKTCYVRRNEDSNGIAFLV